MGIRDTVPIEDQLRSIIRSQPEPGFEHVLFVCGTAIATVAAMRLATILIQYTGKHNVSVYNILHFCVTAAILAPAFILVRKFHKRQLRRDVIKYLNAIGYDFCKHCGYSLRGNRTRTCPECGQGGLRADSGTF